MFDFNDQVVIRERRSDEDEYIELLDVGEFCSNVYGNGIQDEEYIYKTVGRDKEQYQIPILRIVELTDEFIRLQPVRVLREPVDMQASTVEDYEYKSRMTNRIYYELYQVPILSIDDYGDEIKFIKTQTLIRDWK